MLTRKLYQRILCNYLSVRITFFFRKSNEMSENECSKVKQSNLIINNKRVDIFKYLAGRNKKNGDEHHIFIDGCYESITPFET